MENGSKHIANNIELIAGFFTNELSKKDVKKLSNWIKADSVNEKLFKEYRKAWDSIGQIKIKKEIDIDAEWKKLNTQLADSPTENPKLISLQKEPVSIFKKVLKIAAIFILGIFTSYSAYYLIKHQGNAKILADTGTKEVVLPDGSEITINANTSIKYPKTFSDDIRKVQLSGEAYFEIVHNEEKSFIVEVEGAVVKVLGTKFNVRAYKNDKIIEVVVDTGKVSFSRLDEYEEIILQTGDVGTYSLITNELKKSVKINNNTTAWKTKKMRFRKASLSKVVKTLNKVYHTNIVIKNDEIKDCEIEALFDGQSLESVIKVITAIHPHIDFSKTKNGYVVMGVNCE